MTLKKYITDLSKSRIIGAKDKKKRKTKGKKIDYDKQSKKISNFLENIVKKENKKQKMLTEIIANSKPQKEHSRGGAWQDSVGERHSGTFGT